MKSHLDIAIENLYTTFSSYSIKGDMRERSCECCVSDDEIKLLLSTPLKEITEKQMSHYLWSAISTFGNIEDYKHFLPRILELTTLPKSELIEDFLICERLNYAEWKTWKENEVKTIQDYFISFWLKTLSDENATFFKVENVLIISSRYLGIEKCLEIWNDNLSMSSLNFIIEYVYNINHLDLDENDLEVFKSWISRTPILKKVESLFLETKDKIEAYKISVVYTILENENKNTKQTF